MIGLTYMKFNLVMIQLTLLVSLALALFNPAFADEKNASGAHIYKEVCSTCHSTGVANAPKLGDQNAWKN